MINGHMVTLLNPVLSKVALYLLIPNLPLSELWHKKASTLEFSRSSSRMSKEVSQQRKDYVDPPPAPLIDLAEIKLWSFYRALIAEFIATLLFLYVTVATVIGHKKQTGPCDGVGLLGIAWAFGGMIFVLVYCTAGISGNPPPLRFCISFFFFFFFLLTFSFCGVNNITQVDTSTLR